MPNRTEVIERLRGMAGLLKVGDQLPSHADDLLAAAELLEAGEGRTEYRVAHDQHGSDETWELPQADPSSLPEARRHLNGFEPRGGRYNVRIQKRTVTETEWRTLEDDDASA